MVMSAQNVVALDPLKPFCKRTYLLDGQGKRPEKTLPRAAKNKSYSWVLEVASLKGVSHKIGISEQEEFTHRLEEVLEAIGITSYAITHVNKLDDMVACRRRIATQHGVRFTPPEEEYFRANNEHDGNIEEFRVKIPSQFGPLLWEAMLILDPSNQGRYAAFIKNRREQEQNGSRRSL